MSSKKETKTAITVSDLEKKISEVKQIDVLNELNQEKTNESEDQEMTTDELIEKTFEGMESMETEQKESEVIEMENVKTLNDLAVGDQVLLVHTVRGKVSKELKEITDKTSKALKIGSLQFSLDSGFGRSGVSEGKRIFIPSQSDLDAMKESQAKANAFSEAKFKLLELSSMLESSQASSQALKDFTYQVDVLASSLL